MKKLVPLLGLALFLGALWVLHNVLREYHYKDIALHLRELPLSAILLALFLTFLNYFILTGYDTLAIRYIKHPLPYPKIALASFVSYAFSQNLGFPLLTGGSVRYGLYSSWGLSTLEITQIVAFSSLTFWLGVFSIGGAAMLLEPRTIHDALHLPLSIIPPIGFLLVGLAIGYLIWAALSKEPVRIKGWDFTPPSLRLATFQLLISSMDWALAGAVLFVLLPKVGAFTYPGLLGLFVVAQVAGVLSHVPGGLGVFESAILLILTQRVEAAVVFGALIAYRAIYYLLPLLASAVALGAHEVFKRRHRVKRVARVVGQWAPELAPPLMAVLTFICGVILVFSSATPAAKGRLPFLEPFVPLAVVEAAQWISSISGVGLMVVARGLLRRLDGAFIMAIGLLFTGIVSSLLKGLDYEEAITLTVLLVALVPCRTYFYRKASLTSEPFTRGWVLAILLVLATSVYLTLFSFQHIQITWWEFTMHGDAPRALRAGIGAVGAAFAFAVYQLMRPAPPEPGTPGPEEVETVREVIGTAKDSCANLALLGDKTFLISESKKSFLMYGVEGRSWVCFGDPVGEEDEMPELVWRFREMCDRHEGWTVFYQVSRDHLPIYVDLGLTLLKLGEEARVKLSSFSLDGQSRKTFRNLVNKLEREGWVFQIEPAERVPALLPRLKELSDEWLLEKNTREKRFSLGAFDEEYLKNFPAGLVKQGDKIEAFVNLWPTGPKEELSVDLMRYGTEAPPAIMDFLFIKLMLWGKENGYEWFNLGMSPLAGMEDHALAPLWNRMGAFLSRHGEHFYNFQGLRQYKQKFDPEWQAKYLASPGGLVLPRILTNVASLISGGLKGVVAK